MKVEATGKLVPDAQTSATDKSTQKETTQLTTTDMPSTTTGTPLKRSATQKKPKAWKKSKAFKTDSEVTTLIKGNLNDIENIIHEATREAVDEAMLEQHIVLGEL